MIFIDFEELRDLISHDLHETMQALDNAKNATDLINELEALGHHCTVTLTGRVHAYLEARYSIAVFEDKMRNQEE